MMKERRVEDIFAERLREAIAANGTNQSEVARAVGMSVTQVCTLCAGKGGTPRGYYLVRMCKLLNVSADYLLGITDEYRKTEDTMDFIRIKSGKDITFMNAENIVALMGQEGRWYVKTKDKGIYATVGDGVTFYNMSAVEDRTEDYCRKYREEHEA